MFKFIKSGLLALATVSITGCVAVPVDSGYYSPPPVHYAPPAFYGPSVEIGIYRGPGFRHAPPAYHRHYRHHSYHHR